MHLLRPPSAVQVLFGCFLLTSCFSQTAFAADPTLVAAWTKEPVTIDGRLNEAAWKSAPAAGPFTVLGSKNKPSAVPTSVKVLTDGKNLLLGFKCSEPRMNTLVAIDRKRDEPAFLDDSVEVFIDPDNSRQGMVHFCTNALGSIYDASVGVFGTATREEKTWDGSAKVATSRDNDAWYAEISIPLKDLALGDVFPATLGINLCRNHPRPEGAEFSSWSPCETGFAAPNCLGELTLPSEAGEAWLPRFSHSPIFIQGAPLPPLSVENRSAKARTVRCSFDLVDPTSTTLKSQSAPVTVASRATGVIQLPVAPALVGLHRLIMRVDDVQTSQRLTATARDFDVRPPLEVRGCPISLYTHRAEGKVYLWQAGTSGTRLHVWLEREGNSKPLASTDKPAPAVGTPISVSFDLKGQPAGHYVLNAQLLNSAQPVITGSSALLNYEPKPEYALDKSGVLQVDGKPFFVVGMYTLQNRKGSHDEVLAEARAAGFNTTVFYASTPPDLMPLMDAAQRNGIRAFVYPTLPTTVRKRNGTIAEIRSDVDERTTHPALLGWYVVDEPEGIGETSPQTVETMYQTVKQTDTQHPASLVVMSPAAARRYGESSDIVWVDPYPVPEQPVTYVSETVAGAVKAVPNHPVWAVLQAFDWNVWNKGHLVGPHRPTPAEARCMTYLALVHGAKGIIYWAHTASKYYIEDYPEHWAAMKGLAGELRDLSPVLLTESAATKPSIEPRNAPVDLMVKQHEGQTYVFAVNHEPKTCEVHFNLPGVVSDKPVAVMFENRSVSADKTGWKDSFEPLAVHVYRLESAPRPRGPRG